MKYLLSKRNSFISLLLAVAVLSGCTPLIGAHSPTAYKNATSLKAETLAIMDKATEQYSQHKDRAEKIVVDLSKAHEYVKGLPRNSISTKQWKKLIDKKGDLIGKFFTRWKDDGTLLAKFIDEFKRIVEEAFDEIICLEANKKAAADCKQPKENSNVRI